MKQFARACLSILCLAVFVVSSTAQRPIDFSELDKHVPEELKEKNTPGAVITIINGDQVVEFLFTELYGAKKK
jgi:hypothetical protein